MTVLFVSSLAHGGTCEMRRKVLERLGHPTIPFSYVTHFHRYPTLARMFQWHLRTGPAMRKINGTIIDAVKTSRPDLLWIEKGWFVWPSTLRRVRSLGAHRAVLYSPDNYFIRQNTSRHLQRGLPLYDLVVTTKTFNVEPLQQCGARKVLLSGNAFSPDVHAPAELSQAEHQRFGCDVSFVGRWEPERERWLEAIANLNVRLAIWGPHWERARSRVVQSCFRGGPALESEYAKAISGSRINLCFLSRISRDYITQRSVEIPACGGFMLAERTDEHLAHFREGIDAAYFGSLDELLQRIRYYLDNDAERSRIRQAGRERCIKEGFSYDARVSQILQELSH